MLNGEQNVVHYGGLDLAPSRLAGQSKTLSRPVTGTCNRHNNMSEILEAMELIVCYFGVETVQFDVVQQVCSNYQQLPCPPTYEVLR